MPIDIQVDSYGLNFLFTHGLRARRLEALARFLITPAWHKAKNAYDPSRQSLAADISAYLQILENQSQVVDLVAFSFLYSLIGSIAAAIPPDGLVLMVSLGNGEEAIRLAELYTDPVDRVNAFARIVEELSVSRDFEKARQVAQLAFDTVSTMPALEFRERALSLVAVSFARAKDVLAAVEIAKPIENEVFQVQTLSRIAAIGFQNDHEEFCFDLAASLQHIPLRVFAFSGIYQFAKKEEISPWVSAAGEEIQQAVKDYLWNEYPIEFRTSMVRSLLDAGEVSKGFSIGRESLDGHWFIRALRGLKDPQLAYLLLKKLPEKEFAKGEASDVAKIYAASGHVDEAFALVEGLGDGDRGRDGVYAVIIWELASQSLFEDAQMLVSKIGDKSIQSWALAGLGQGLLKNGRAVEAEDALRWIQQNSRTLSVYKFENNKALIALGHAVFNGHYARLDEILQSEVYSFDEAVLGKLVDACLSMHAWETGKLLAGAIVNPHLRNNTLLKLFKAMLYADAVLNHKEEVDKLPGGLHEQATLFVIKKALDEDQSVDSVLPCLGNLDKKTTQSEALSLIAQKHLRDGDFENARSLIERIPSRRSREQAYLEYILALAKNGQVREAWDATSSLAGNQKLSAYERLYPYLDRHPALAQQVYDYCKGTRFEFSLLTLQVVRSWQAGAYDVAIGLIENVATNKQVNIWSGMVNSIGREIQYDEKFLSKLPAELQDTMQLKIALMGLAENKIDDAFRIANAMSSEGYKHKVYREIVETLLGLGQYEKAIGITQSNISPSAQNHTLTLIVEKMIEEKRFLDALALIDQIQSVLLRSNLRENLVCQALVVLQNNHVALYEVVYRMLRNAREHGQEDLTSALDNAALAIGALVDGPALFSVLHEKIILMEELAYQ